MKLQRETDGNTVSNLRKLANRARSEERRQMKIEGRSLLTTECRNNSAKDAICRIYQDVSDRHTFRDDGVGFRVPFISDAIQKR
jgi:hypothetical protein